MSARARLAGFVAIAFVVVTAVTAYTVAAARDYQRQHDAPPSVATVAGEVELGAIASRPHIVFRHTGVDRGYGVVAMVPLDDPGGPRAFTDVDCDRVYATAAAASCLRTERGVVTRFELVELDSDWEVTATHPLPGIPNRTRVSPDGSLLSTTTFVSGHSYEQVGFSTATEIRGVGGSGHGNLEEFDLVVDGVRVTPRDRNVWGVTFAAGGDTFYATVGTRGHTYLVRGDLGARTLTAVADHVECPSLSPDGTRIGFKEATERDGRTWWTPAVLDLATGERTVLRGETHNLDDQVEWLDDDTLLYGLPRDGESGVSDVWSLDVSPAAEPRLLIEQAWSPAVVRP